MAPNEIRQLSFRPIPPPLTELDIMYPDGIYLGEPVPHDERNGNPENRIHTDAIITILPEHLANIVSQQKNHEYRKYRIPDGVQRLWFFETIDEQGQGQSAITHIALIPLNTRLEPGHVPEQPFGIGNKEFNLGQKVSRYGYPIIELYELHQPITKNELQQHWNYQDVPKHWSFVPTQMWNEIWKKQQVWKLF